MRSTVEISINKITQSQGIYPRFNTDFDRVNMFVELMEAGEKFPPVKVTKHGDSYVLLDGNHRLEARKKIGKEKIPADIFDTPKQLWRLAAARFNGKGSLPLKGEEFKRVIVSAWTIDEIHDTYKIAHELGCSDRYVRKVLQPIRDEEKAKLEKQIKEMRDKGVSQREVAKKVGVSDRTVGKIEKMANKQDANLRNLVPLVRTVHGDIPNNVHHINEKGTEEIGSSEMNNETKATADRVLTKTSVQAMNTGKSLDRPAQKKEAEAEALKDPDAFPLSALDDPDFPLMVKWKPGQRETHRALDMIGKYWSVDRIAKKLDMPPGWVRNTALAMLLIYHYGHDKYDTGEIAEKFKMNETRVEYLIFLNLHFNALPPGRKTLVIWLQDYPPRNQDSEYIELLRREKIYQKCREEGKKPPWEYQADIPEAFIDMPLDINDKFYQAADFVNEVAELVSVGLFREEKMEKNLLGRFNVLYAAMNNLRDSMQRKDYIARANDDSQKLSAYNYIHKGKEGIALVKNMP